MKKKMKKQMKAQIPLSILVLLTVFAIFTGCKNRNVERRETQQTQIVSHTKTDTIVLEKVIYRETVRTDTVIKKVFDFKLAGKSKYDSINKIWLPFNFDYTVYNGSDSIRHKGSITGDFNLDSGFNWEKAYHTLKKKFDSKEKETGVFNEAFLKSDDFKEKAKAVKSEAFTTKTIIYLIVFSSFFFYLIGLFTPTVYKQLKSRLSAGRFNN